MLVVVIEQKCLGLKVSSHLEFLNLKTTIEPSNFGDPNLLVEEAFGAHLWDL